jgi:hypothetical protein
MHHRNPAIANNSIGPLIFRGISVDERAQFKAYCARRGTTMTAEIRDYIRRCLGLETPINPTPVLKRKLK